MKPLNLKIMKPSDFTNDHPMASVLRKGECEIVAYNVMVILSRTGDKFRQLSWDEYSLERNKDGKFTDKEKYFFE